MHILLVRFSSMGDVVLQTATVNWLRALIGPELRLSFLTSSEFLPLLEGHPGLERLIGFDRREESWKQLLDRIDAIDRDDPFTLILDLHATTRSLRLKLSYWNVPALTVDKRRWERFLLTTLKGVGLKRLIAPSVFGLEPQVVRIIRDIESVFGDRRGVWRAKETRKGPHGEMTSLALPDHFELPGPYVVLAPSASFLPKRWPVENFVTLARELLAALPHHVVILAGPGDEFCRAFDAITSDRLHNLQGKTSLKESMAILSRAQLSVGNDSGMNHIAEAYGIPCVTLFGPTDPRFGFAPHGDRSSYLSKELWCKPCSNTGKKSCFRDRLHCMELITVAEVRDLALKTLAQP